MELVKEFPNIKFACKECTDRIFEENFNKDEILTEESMVINGDTNFRILSYCTKCFKPQKIRTRRRFNFIKTGKGRGSLCYNCSQKKKNDISIKMQTKPGNCSICGIYSTRRNIAGVGLDNCNFSSINIKKAVNFISTDIPCDEKCNKYKSCEKNFPRNIYGFCYYSSNKHSNNSVYKRDDSGRIIGVLKDSSRIVPDFILNSSYFKIEDKVTTIDNVAVKVYLNGIDVKTISENEFKTLAFNSNYLRDNDSLIESVKLNDGWIPLEEVYQILPDDDSFLISEGFVKVSTGLTQNSEIFLNKNGFDQFLTDNFGLYICYCKAFNNSKIACVCKTNTRESDINFNTKRDGACRELIRTTPGLDWDKTCVYIKAITEEDYLANGFYGESATEEYIHDKYNLFY